MNGGSTKVECRCVVTVICAVTDGDREILHCITRVIQSYLVCGWLLIEVAMWVGLSLTTQLYMYSVFLVTRKPSGVSLSISLATTSVQPQNVSMHSVIESVHAMLLIHQLVRTSVQPKKLINYFCGYITIALV